MSTPPRIRSAQRPPDRDTAGRSRTRAARWKLGVLLTLATLSTVAIFGPFPSEIVTAFVIVTMVTLLLLRVPLAVAMFVPGLLGLWALRSERLPIETLMTLPYQQIASWSLTVIPMYLLLGLVLSRSGLATDLYRAIAVFIPRLPANLAVASNLAGSGLATVSGSTMSTVLAMAGVGVPEMLRAGYDRRFAVGAVIVAGLAGPLIPPSILAIIYASVAGTPIGPQLLAGILPGVLVVVTFTAAMVVIALVWPNLAGSAGRHEREPRPRITWTERSKAARKAWVFPIIILIIVGGLYTGFFTATEAGAAAALVAILATLPRLLRQKSVRPLWFAVTSTVASTGAIFFLIMGAATLSRLVVLSGLGRTFVEFVESFDLTAVQFLLVMAVVYLILGTVMDTLPLILMTVPVVLPILDSLDISTIWYGVFIIIMCEISMLTPPMGSLLYVTHRAVQDPEINLGQRISLGDMLKTVSVIVLLALIIVVLLIAFPDIALLIPNSSSSG